MSSPADRRSARLFSYAALVAVGVAGAIAVARVDRVSTAGLHTGLEGIATALALAVGALAMARHFHTPSPRMLYVGIGFWGTALLDGYHAFVTSTFFAPLFPSSAASLIAWSWLASRVFLAGVLGAALLAGEREGRARRDVPEGRIYGIVAALLAGSVVLFTLVPMPRAYYPELSAHRPQDLVAGALFLVVTAAYLRRGRWRDDVLDRFLVLSLLANVVAQTSMMPFSAEVFDEWFDAAHVTKCVSYALALAGVALARPTTRTISAPEEQAAAVVRQLTARSAVAFGLLAVLVAGGYAAQYAGTRALEGDAAMVNEAGRQRMLVQRTAVLATRLANAEPTTRPSARRDLLATADELESTRAELLRRAAADDHERFASALKAAPVQSYVDTARRLAEIERVHRGHPTYARLERAALGGELIASLEAATRAMALEADAAASDARRLAAAVLLLLLVGIAATGGVAVWPAIQRVRADLARTAQIAQRDTQRLFDVSLDLMTVVTLDGRFKRVNPAFETVLGHAPHELLDRPLFELVHPDDLEATRAELGKLGRGEPVLYFTNRYRTHAGTYRWLSWRALAIPEDEIVFATARDVTDERRMQTRLEQHARELERSNEALDQFAYVASHDLRSPLRDVQNLAAWIREDAADELPEASKQHLEKLGQRIARMDALLDALLQYSRAGRVHGDVETVRPSEIVERARGQISVPDGFRVVVAGDDPKITTPTTPLLQVVRNLLDNAIKHHDRDTGRIEVDVRDADDVIEIRVADDGPGIEADHHERVFQMFQRLTDDRERAGTGVGLALVKKLVETYGGTIRIEPTRRRGTTFWFTWPKSWSIEVRAA